MQESQRADARTETENEEASTTANCSRTFPSAYILPAFPPIVENALGNKDDSLKLRSKSKARAALIQVLFDDITKHTL